MMTPQPPAAVDSALDSVGVAVAQFRPGADQGDNLAAMRALAVTAVARGAELIVFPE